MKMHNIKPMKFLALSLLLFLFSSEGFAAKSPFPGDTTIFFEGSSDVQKFSFEVLQGHHLVTQRLWGDVQGGDIYVRIYDSRGIKRGGFSLVSGKTRARGTAEDVHKDFPTGTWTVEISSEEANGKLRIQIKLD